MINTVTVLGAAPPLLRIGAGGPAAFGKFAALRALSIFRDGSDSELERLAEAASLRRVGKRRIVAFADLGDGCVLLVRGRAKRTVARGRSDGELILDLLGAGDLLSERCWVSNDPGFGGETITLEDSVVVVVPRRALDELLEDNASVAMRLLETLARRIARTATLAAQNSCFAVGDRLYCRVVELAHARGRPESDGTLVEHGLTQRELAAFSAASREMVNRQLAEWKSQGWIHASRYAVLVRDVDALTRSVTPEARRVGFGAGDGRNVFVTR